MVCRCAQRMPCAVAPASFPTIIAYAVLVVSCLVMAAVGHPQCSAPGQLANTRNHAETLQGWVVAMVAAGLCGFYVSGAGMHAPSDLKLKALQSLSLQRSEGVRVYVTKIHLRTLALVLAPSVLITALISIVPERVCLISEVRVLFIGAIFTACK